MKKKSTSTPKRSSSSTRAKPSKSSKPTGTKGNAGSNPAKPHNSSPKTRTADSSSSKQGKLIALLKLADGATLPQMTKLTGWQTHSVRGVISGVLRKKLNLNVVSNKAPDGGVRIYRISEAAVTAKVQ